MFRNRTTSQKPNDELYAAFKQNFPQLPTLVAASSVGEHNSAVTTTSADPSDGSSNPTVNPEQLEAQPESKETGLTPGRATADQWRFTPSMFDSNFTFGSSFINGPHGYYTPTPGGINTVYHNPTAGDLHTPGLAFQLGTPLSMPMAEGSLHPPPTFDMQGFNPSFFQTNFPGHHQHSHPQFPAHPTAYPPSMLVHQDSGYPAEKTPEEDPDINMKGTTDLQSSSNLQAEGRMGPPNIPSDKFRYHVTLNAPTAMIRQPDETPMTYLNKGQAYTLSILDHTPALAMGQIAKYRTVIRISFEDEQQRKRPSSCWQLWKEGRGIAESGQRGGRLQAVEYVDPHPGAEDDPRRPKIELDKTSFDSFSVIWSPPLTSSIAECSVAVRFNFLSTDFSHSKGVKGIPVRLCAKTEMLHPNQTASPAEVSYCMVKLFRDHGAERKLANDVLHVKKSIEKLKTQIAQLETGMKDSKRKRTASQAGKTGGERPGKMAKHKRTWSMSSQGSGGRPAGEDDLHQKLAAVQDMFTSTRPVSLLYLRGAEQDDPDLFPVSLPGEGKDKAVDRSWDREESMEEGSLDSPILSTKSMPGNLRRSSTYKLSREASGDWPQSATVPPSNFSTIFEAGPTRVPKTSVPGWIDAVDIDSSYIPPAERIAKPIACFYVLVGGGENKTGQAYHRAVYLLQRTVADLVSSIASKCDLDPSRVHRTLQVNSKGLEILVDEELVREIPEGQDMVVEIKEIETGIKPELPTLAEIVPKPLEMRLFF